MSKKLKDFSFNKKNLKEANEIIAKYPEGRQKSAILPLLDLAQRQNEGWLPMNVIEYVAEFLKIPLMKAYEVATFYSMFNLKPVGKYHIQLCGTTPCWLGGSDKIKKAFEKETKINCGSGISKDGLFTISEVECLGACRDAPLVQINDDYHENLDIDRVKEIVQGFKEKNA